MQKMHWRYSGYAKMRACVPALCTHINKKMRQIAGSFAQYEKTRLVTKLRGARERVREARGRCEGRKAYAEREPELVLAAKRLHRRSPKGHRRSLREIATELATMGYKNRNGTPYSASCVKSMVEGPTRAPSERSVPA